MLRERNAIAKNVAEHLWDAERTNDVALASTARLLATALDARLRLKAGACVGHTVVEALAATITQQTSSRRILLEAHDVLDGLKTIAVPHGEDFGGSEDKEVPKRVSAGTVPLRQVA